MLSVGDYTIKNGPACSAEVLASVSKPNKPVKCFVSDRLHSGTSYSAVGGDFNINASTIIINNYIKEGVCKHT